MIAIKYNPALTHVDIFFNFNEDEKKIVKELGAIDTWKETDINKEKTASLWKLGLGFNKKEKKFKGWILPLNDETFLTLENIKHDNRFNIDPLVFDAIQTIKEWEAENLRLSYSVNASSEKGIFINEYKIKKFQECAFRYMVRNSRGVILADDIEFYRKVEALSIMGVDGLPCLIITETDEDAQAWIKTIEKIAPRISYNFIQGYTWEEEKKASVYIIKYNLLHKYLNLLCITNWKLTIFDRSRFLYNKNNLAFKNAKEIAYNATRKILISDTDIKKDAWKIALELELLGLVNEFGGFWKIINQYTKSYMSGVKGWVFQGSHNIDKFEVELRKKCYIRRTKEQIA